MIQSQEKAGKTWNGVETKVYNLNQLNTWGSRRSVWTTNFGVHLEFLVLGPIKGKCFEMQEKLVPPCGTARYATS